MRIIDLEATAKRVIKLMGEDGLSKSKIREYSNLGFSVIINYFESIGIKSVTSEQLDKYIIEQKRNVEKGDLTYKQWKRLHRSSEFLKYCAEKDSIDIPNGTRWDYIKDYTRNNIWEHPPSELQLADPDNIYTLVWKTGKALETSGMTADRVIRYKSPALKTILQLHINAETEDYSEQLVKDKVTEMRNSYECGQVSYGIFQEFRKASQLVQEMHETGNITMSILPDWGFREPIEPYKLLLDEYVVWEKSSCVLCENSINEMRYRIRAFLFALEDNGYDSMECFNRKIVSNIVTDLVKKSSGDFKNVVKPIKKFLVFLFERNYTDTDLSLSLPEFASKKKTFHEGFSKDEVTLLLEQPDRKTARGKRDYAIMILAAQTGLRGCDIVGLKYENIDWRAREIRLTQRKTGKPLAIPLEPESGNAVAEYILNGRPKSNSPYIFLSDKGVHDPLNSHTGVLIVSRYMQKVGINSNYRSIHAFRRTYGTKLLQNEVSLEMIRQLLGHSNMNSTKPYLSVNEQGLKNCALSLITKIKGGDDK